MSELENRINRFKQNPYALILIGILILASVIRLNYFNANQAVWWDEAEYLLQAKHWAFNTPNTGWGEVRPILLPFILSILYKLGGTETAARILILIFSMLGIYLAYLVGKEIFNKETGLIAAFLLSVFYLDVFHTIRVLVDTPSIAMFLLLIFLFWRGWYKDKKYMYFFGLALSFGVALRFTVGLALIVILLYLLITEKFNFLKRKELWIAGVISFIAMIPYFIWSQITYGNPLRSMLRSSGDGIKYSFEKGFGEATSRLFTYITSMPDYLQLALFILFIIGLISFYKLIIGFDLILKNKADDLKKYLFMVLWILIPLLYFSFLFHVFDVRYLLPISPAIFIIGALGSIIMFNFIKKYNKILAISFVIIILLIVGYQQSTLTKQVVDSRAFSFVQFKYAGEWLKERTQPGDIIFNTGVPQNTYYTERETFGHGTEENFNDRLKEDKIKYFVVSILERPPDWVFTYPQRNPDKLRPVYICDNSLCTEDLSRINQQSVTLIVYEVL